MGAKTLPENKKSTGQKTFDFRAKFKNFSAKNGSTFWLYFFAFSPEGFSKPSSRLQRLPSKDFWNSPLPNGNTTSFNLRYLTQNLVRRIYLHYLCSSNTESITFFEGLSPAEIAQLVEHNLAKVRVASSSLVSRSRITYYIWGYSSVWESDALALRRSAVRSRLSPPLIIVK